MREQFPTMFAVEANLNEEIGWGSSRWVGGIGSNDANVRNWACSAEGRDIWCHNLGPKDKVAEVLSGWLASQDCDEGACD
jgi:hypothetical protein